MIQAIITNTRTVFITPMIRAYEEIVDFIAAVTSPESVVNFQPSKTTKERVAELIRREKTMGLSPQETSELSH